MSPPLRAVVFDLDDTLTDHRGLEADVWEATAADILAHHPEVDLPALTVRHRANLEHLYEDFLAGRFDLLGFGRARLADALVPWGIAPSDELLEVYMEHKMRFAQETWPGPNGAAAVAAARDAGLAVGILTNGHTDHQAAKLERLGLHGHVDALVTSEAAGATKPSPVAFAAALAALDVGPEEVAMVGDNPVNDIHGALGAGWRAAVLVRHEGPTPALPPGALLAADALDALRVLRVGLP